MSNELNPNEYVDPTEAAQAADPHYGAGSPETAPWTEPAVSWLRSQPILAALLAINLPLLIGFVEEFADQQTDATAVTLMGVAIVLLNVVGAIVRQAVTPTARPRDDDGNPLTPPGA